MVILTISVLFAAAFIFGGYLALHYHEMPVAYGDLSQIQSTARAILCNSDYYSAHAIFKQIDKESSEQIAYIHYTKTLLNDKNSAVMIIPFGSIDLVGPPPANMERLDVLYDAIDNVSSIYYFVGDYKKLAAMPDEEFYAAAKDAILIWEK
jgi:hypothetical protein